MARGRRRRKPNYVTISLPAKDDPRSTVSEAYRTLRTNIQYYGLDEPLKCLLFTSAGPAEGKSATIANLAITIAQQGKKVLLVDADLRRPMLHSAFNIGRSGGLTAVISGAMELDDAVMLTDVENLYLMPTGPIPPNPSELLGTNRAQQLFEYLKDVFDMVLVDSPPLLPVTDAAVLSRYADGVVLVVRSGQTTKEALLQAQHQLLNAKARILGTVLNDVSIDRSNYHYYYYYYGSRDEK